MRNRKLACIATAIQAIIFCAVLPMHGKDADIWTTATSIKGSQKLKRFIRVIRVEPTTFSWDGHTVIVRECWLEQSSASENSLRFKLSVDGNRYKETQIWDKHKSLIFKLEDSQIQQRANYFVTRRMWENLVGGAHGEIIHTLRLGVSERAPVKLRVGTEIGTGQPGSKQEWTDTVLTFHVRD
jgi:hypothetical protein